MRAPNAQPQSSQGNQQTDLSVAAVALTVAYFGGDVTVQLETAPSLWVPVAVDMVVHPGESIMTGKSFLDSVLLTSPDREIRIANGGGLKVLQPLETSAGAPGGGTN